ncbi:hypothetical protein TD95_000897 [Thielaviopsis punctulata]|uniref:CBM6 domain-containing protein n=1 Tax=Thielaviopsis punctulata TaxID=72032 RepID=A0A0F4ZFG9_9PEZI|nr:hypothetical protein TD95_000897 [Thielaviopsis punctulata]
MLSKSISALAIAAVPALASLQIVPGADLPDNRGLHVQAHGTGAIRIGDTYYIVGEDKTNGSAFQNINCYSSKDLVQWEYEGALLSRTAEAGDLGPNRVVERPKVIYNDQTKKYVLWMHIDSSNYGEAKTGVATSDTVCGKYDYHGSFQPLGHQSRDMSLFKDDDGTAYLLSEDRATGLRIDKLSDDYLNVTGETFTWYDHIEAPAMYKNNGIYYMFGSHLSGWDPNDNVYSTSTNISSGWSVWKDFAPAGTKTFKSQTSFILPYGDAGNVMYMGDRWISSDLASSTYVWLPLTIDGASVTMDHDYVNWEPNVQSGAWSVDIPETWPEAEDGTPSGGARVVSCPGCSGSAMGYIGGSGDGAVTISNITVQQAGITTVRVKYFNGDSTPRYANVSVNGVSQTLEFIPSHGAVASLALTVSLELQNEFVIEGAGNGRWGPDIDRLMVPLR